MKKDVRELTILGGGQPCFREILPVGRPNVGDREKLFDCLRDILETRWFTNNGRYVQELERRIADFIGVRHCVALCNATVGLEIAVKALDLTGEVIVPSFTFIATVHALRWHNITPVFCDIAQATHNIDDSLVERLITPRTSAIVGVHLWGRPCGIDNLKRIAGRQHLKLIFDAAHAFGCSYNDQMIGNFGDLEIFSFHATKFFNCFEGGAIVTNDDGLAEKARLMRNFGFSGYDRVDCLGTNGKMSEISAAMGLTGIDKLPEFIERNRRNYHCYRKELSGIPGLRLCVYDEGEKCNFQYIVVEVDETLTGISRDMIIDILWAENVMARRYFFPGCHRMEPYCSLFPAAGNSLSVTERIAGKVVVLPNGASLTEDAVRSVCAVLKIAAINGRELQTRLAGAAAKENLP